MVHLARQDLSVAGKRAGLAGARSGLFMEQIRIVKEMRQADERAGRTGGFIRPRYMVWENVPGAFSSNKGRDFAAVLEEIIRIAEPEAPDIEVPAKGWPTWGGYHDCMGGRWSVAWRVHDAQHWGVPQRRRRISIVADFGGDTAGEISFERKSVSGNLAPCGAAGEGLAAETQGGASYAVRIRSGCDGGGKGALVQTEKSGTLGTGNDQTIFCMATQQGGAELRSDDRAPTLTAAAGMSGNNQPVIAIPINDKATRYAGGGSSRNHDGSGNGLGIGRDGDPSPTITAGDRHIVAAFKLGNVTKANGNSCAEKCEPTPGAVSSGTNQVPALLLDMSHANDVIRECGEIAPSLQARMGTGGNQVPLVYGIGNGQANEAAAPVAERAQTLNSMHDAQAVLAISAVDCRNFTEGGEINGTLQAKESGGQSLNLNNVVHARMVARRLTPLECERLQGYPDGWTDIGEWRDGTGKLHKDADSPRYKACGNSIALPFWSFLAKRISAQYIRPVTMGSLFDGISGFCLCFAKWNGANSCRWASEIEEFPIAVAKKHFGDEETGEVGDIERIL